MAYTKKTWVKGNTPLSAENFNHMEQGIADAHTDIAQLNSDLKNAFVTQYAELNGTGNNYFYVDRKQGYRLSSAILHVYDTGYIRVEARLGSTRGTFLRWVTGTGTATGWAAGAHQGSGHAGDGHGRGLAGGRHGHGVGHGRVKVEGHDVQAGVGAGEGRRGGRSGGGKRRGVDAAGAIGALGLARAGLDHGGRAADAGVAAQEDALLLAQAHEGAGVHVLGEDGELAGLEGRVDHEAHQRLSHEGVALLLGLGRHEGAGLVGDLLVERAHEGIVGRGDQHGVEGRRGVHAVDLVGLVLHLASGPLGQLLKREGLGVALGGRTKDGADAPLEVIQKAHRESSPSWPSNSGPLRTVEMHRNAYKSTASPACTQLGGAHIPPFSTPAARHSAARRTARPTLWRDLHFGRCQE